MVKNTFGLMLYSKDVLAEKTFWQALGFVIIEKEDIMGYPTFDMKIDSHSPVTFTVFDLSFIEKMSPEVANNQPSILFESSDLVGLHARVKEVSAQVSPIQEQPFKNFNFQAPSGHYYAVKEI
ncbi:glyoxalase [Streptococcus sp. sy004]|uniref:glyoxalase n=1 Tax=Streptococcus sp. sy004 TaxID=2600149 RepID=UPI0037DA37A4